MSERDSLAAQLRAQLVKANESLAYLKENLDATWCMVDVKDLEAIVAALGAAADRLEVLEQEKTTHRWVQHSNSRDAESLAACQRELAETAKQVAQGESSICRLNWMIESMLRAANGEALSDFDESEVAVRTILDLTLRAEAAEAERDQLRKAARGLVAYRDRVGPLGFQLEKADHHIGQLRNILSLSPQETP